MNYDDECKAAADAQGVSAVHDALTARGIVSEVWQTGGFTMLCAVPLERDASGEAVKYIGCNAEGAGVIDERRGCDNFASITTATDPAAIAEAVAKWIRLNPRGILTVGQLRQTLAGLDDSTQVVVATNSWYLNVSSVELPDDETFVAVTLFTANTYDPRQH